MSKPDFFLPFHLPTVLADYDLLNIAYEGFMLDRNMEYDRNMPVEKDFIERHRINNGVYQTVKFDVRHLCVDSGFAKLFPFSISLN